MIARLFATVTASVLALPALGDTQTRTSAFEYDSAGLLIKEIVEPDSSTLCLVKTYRYDAFGNRDMITVRNCGVAGDPTGVGTSGEAGQPTGIAAFAMRTSSSVYAAGSSVIGGVTYAWSTGQFPTSSTNPLGHAESRSFDPRFGGVLSLTGPNNLTTNWTHDKFGRKSSETRADGTVTSWFYERCIDLPAGTCPPPESTSYAGEYRVRVTATGSPTTSIYYDRLNREIRSETEGFDGTLVRKDTQYDPRGRIAQVSRPYFAGASPLWTVFTHDDLGRVRQVDEPSVNGMSARTVTEYNGLATKVAVSNAGSGTGMPESVTQIRETTRNSQGQIVKVTQTQQ